VNFFKEHKEGIILTVVFHAALLLILLNFRFFTPLPLPEEKGVLIDFGTTEEGMGNIEPAPKESAPAIPPRVATQPPVIQPKVAKPTPGNENVMTQDYEKTAALEEAKKKADEKNRELLDKQFQDNLLKTAEKRKKDSLQQVENERIAEIRRIAEVKRLDSLRKAAEQAQIDQINSRAKNVFGGASGQGTDANSTGQGTGSKSGNQGSVDGVFGGGQNGSGSGTGSGVGNGKGAGVSYSLSGRNAKSLPKPSYPGNEEAVVVVEVTVDKAGKVTKAVPGAKGSTSLNAGLLEAAKKAALLTRFDENQDAPELQTGLITYRFVLD
jgi:colicin import membrane protein